MMKRFKSHERGFTLVELLVAIPIAGLLGLAMGAVLIQLLHSDRISGGVSALRQAQTAGDSVSQDGMQAQYAIITDNIAANPTGWSLLLRWNTDWTDSTGTYNARSEDITYTLVSANGRYNLQRHEVATIKVGATTTNRNVTRTVSQYLDASQMSCRWASTDNNTLVFTAVAVVGRKTETRTYNVYPRA
jgi:prepilin-type N-terminal cleavage/methylation domain-containing protein